jgi:Dehydratase medium subunit
VTGAGRDRATDRTEPPAVVVHRHADAPPEALREVAAGAEEDGVPTTVLVVQGPGDAAALAHAAARASRLEVGVGLDAAGAVAVHHAKLPPDAPPERVPPGAPREEWRRAGRVAARIVTGLPLRGP